MIRHPLVYSVPHLPKMNAMMNATEIETLMKMPHVITVWRGTELGDKDGFSWTTVKKQALWFAERHRALRGVQPSLLVGKVKRNHVIAFIQSRGESEIIAMPEKVVLLDAATPSKLKQQ